MINSLEAMDHLNQVTPKSQRGIGAFLTGTSASKYTVIKLPKRGRPFKQQKTFQGDISEGLPSISEDGNVAAILQPATADNNDATLIMHNDPDEPLRGLVSVDSSDYKLSVDGNDDGGDSDSDSAAAETPNTSLTRSARTRRLQTQRVHKGQSDGTWRDGKRLRWQVSWAAMWQWAQCVPAVECKGGVNDGARCLTCSLAKGCDYIMEARAATLTAHNTSQAHRDSEALVKQRQVELALRQLQKKDLPQLFAPGNSEAEKARLQQLRRVFCLLDRGRPITDFKASREEFEVLRVPHFSTSHWSITSGWELSEALDSVLLDKTKELVRAARFMALSLDEAVGIDKNSRLCLHLYVMQDWSRAPLLIDVSVFHQHLGGSVLDICRIGR